jgi:hypothetical protein
MAFVRQTCIRLSLAKAVTNPPQSRAESVYASLSPLQLDPLPQPPT